MSMSRNHSPITRHNTNANALSDESNSTDDTMIVLGKFKVHTGLFETVQSSVDAIYPCLIAGVDYTPVDLIGEPLWDDLTGIAQRQAIHCLQHLATLPGSRLDHESSTDFGRTSFQII